MKHIVRDNLNQFLLKKGVKRRFMRNAKDINCCVSGIIHRHDIFAGSFIWALTPEGWEFWEKLDKEYALFLSQLNGQ